MYCPAHFNVAHPEAALELLRAHPLGALVTHSAEGLDANHLPFALVEQAPDAPLRLQAHVARANPLWQQVSSGDLVLVIFRAEQGYISPNWYPSKQQTHRQVPTWNYRVVHVHGRIAVHDDPRFVRGVVARLTRTHEAQVPGTPWKMGDAPADFLDGMIAALVGIEIEVTRIEGKFKLSQNKTAEDLAGAVQGALDSGQRALAEQMRAYLPSGDRP